MASIATTLLASIVIAAQAAPRSEDRPEALSPPLVDGKPVDLAIGFFVYDFARVTAREESFDVIGYLELSWHDPRLATAPDAGSGKAVWRRVDARQVWTPRIFFENALEPPRYHSEPIVETDGRGLVSSWVLVSGKFSAPMDLRHFPFDTQVLPVRIGSFEDESVAKFHLKPELVRVGDEAFLTDWTILEPTARVDSHRYVPGQESYSRYIYQVGIGRRPTFYIWRVMVPLTLLALVSWAVFWFEPVGLQPQISTCMASLIALVAFNFAIDFSLPKVVYLTPIDKHALIGMGFVISAVAAVSVIHIAVNAGRLEHAKRIQRIARWVLLPAYAIAVALNMASLTC
jgi:hypothetical protein